MKKDILCISLLLCLFLQGCSVYMAATQPDKKDISLFKVGTPRGLLLAEFGLPVYEEEKEGMRVEIYKFNKGYSGGAKAGRAVFHGVADVFTWGLWEVIGTPTEMTADGKDMAYQVTYDEKDKIKEVVKLKEK